MGTGCEGVREGAGGGWCEAAERKRCARVVCCAGWVLCCALGSVSHFFFEWSGGSLRAGGDRGVLFHVDCVRARSFSVHRPDDGGARGTAFVTDIPAVWLRSAPFSMAFCDKIRHFSRENIKNA